MYKQAIVVRNDIEMSSGKIAAQAAHASYSSARKSSCVKEWEKEGQKKIVLSAGMEEIKKLEQKCKKSKLACALITDAGHTELKPGTVTALGIGPDKDENIDKITGSLPLLD